MVIVTVVYSAAGHLPGFLDSLLAQTFRNWHLIVVDNDCPQKSGNIAVAVGDSRIQVDFSGANLGFAKGTNRGLRQGLVDGAKNFLILNNDTHFAPDFLAILLAEQERTSADALAPRILEGKEPHKVWYAGGEITVGWLVENTHHLERKNQDLGPDFEVSFLSGCCLLVTRRALLSAGLLDERYFLYWEDTDFCLSLRRAGLRLIYSEVPLLFHDAGASSGGGYSARSTYLYYVSYFQFLTKNFGWLRGLNFSQRLLRSPLGSRPLPAQAPILWRALVVGLWKNLFAQRRASDDP